MEDLFLKKFKSKTKKELQHMVDNQSKYQPAAINAAIRLLNEKQDEQIPIISPIEKESSIEDKSGLWTTSPNFDFKPFIRTLSYREFVTIISLVLFYLALFEVVEYYSNERIFQGSLRTIQVVLTVVFFLANHIIYKLEHDRSNNFIGRSINDIMFIIGMIILNSVHEFIIDGSFHLTYNGNVLGMFFIIFALVIVVFAFESAVALLKLILKRIKCQIF